MNTSPTAPVAIIGGGQSGLAAARAVRDAGLHPIVLEAGERSAGSWPHYYDSLRLFSPARYSEMPDYPFEGDPDRYPTRDEIADYLESYAKHLGVEIRTMTTVRDVQVDDAGFVVHTADGESLPAAAVVASSGSFGNPIMPELPGYEFFTGELLHSAAYHRPEPFSGKRVIVVGGGNSGVQIAHELGAVADLTWATLNPPSFMPQRIGGRDLHYWLKVTGFDRLPATLLQHIVRKPLVLDAGGYRDALESGQLDRRPMFTAFDGDEIVWPDGTREHVDAVIFATGYRPNLDYLGSIDALDDHGRPQHRAGISTTHPGLVYLGLEFQRSFASNTVRGVSQDAEFVVGRLVEHVRQTKTAIDR